MKNRLTLILILLVLVGVLWFVMQDRTVVPVDRPFVEVDSAKVAALSIEAPDISVDLRKTGEGWEVGGDHPYPANVSSVERAIDQLQKMMRGALVTEKPERHAEFEVDDSAATKVAVHQDGQVTVVYLGKTGPTFQTTYARMESSDEVWEVAGNYSGTFKRKAVDWRDKTITKLEMEDIRHITLEYPRETISLSRDTSGWSVGYKDEVFPADKSQVERLARMVSRINTVEFADTLAEDAFDSPELHLTAALTTGETVDFRLIKKDEAAEQYYLRKQDAPSDFVIYKSTADVLMKKIDDLRPKEEDPAKKPQK